MTCRGEVSKRTIGSVVNDNVIVANVVYVPGGTRTPRYKAWWSLGKSLDLYESEICLRRLSEKTVKGTMWALRNMLRAVWENGYETNLQRMGQIEVDFLCGVHYAGRAQSYIAHNLSFLKAFLKWAKNKQIDDIRWPVRNWARPNAKWLSDQEAVLVRDSAEGIERIVVHLELDLGLRRIEVLRLKTCDFKPGRESLVPVLGKGRNGGKPRDVHWHPDTAAELHAYLRLRDAIVARARAKNPAAEVSDSLLVYERAGHVRAYEKSALDNIIKGLARRTGLDFSHHTLRRTCGRMMHRGEAGIESIAAIFGHSDTKTTYRYLGLGLEDQGSAMLKYARYQKAVKIPENGIFGVSQQNGGPCGISLAPPGCFAITGD